MHTDKSLTKKKKLGASDKKKPPQSQCEKENQNNVNVNMNFDYKHLSPLCRGEKRMGEIESLQSSDHDSC